MADFSDLFNNGKPAAIGSDRSIEAFKSAQKKTAEMQGGCGSHSDDLFYDQIPDPAMSVAIGSLILQSPLCAAAGCFGYGLEYGEYQDIASLGAIFSNGTTLEACSGAPQPRLHESVAALLQNTGYENPGVEAVKKDILPYIVSKKATLILNVCGGSAEEMAAVAKAVEGVEGVAALELNLSCREQQSGKVFGRDAVLTEKTVSAVKYVSSLPVIAKLSPDVTDIAAIAMAAEAAGADAVSLINPPAGMAIDVYEQRPVLSAGAGGLCGPAVKPIALKAVWDVFEAVKIPIIGCGGISNPIDVMEFLQAGASAVQIGSANFIQPDCYENMKKSLIRFMKVNGFTKLSKLIGLAHQKAE